MIDLERSLGELAERLEVPGGDWLVDDVLRRIDEPISVVTFLLQERGCPFKDPLNCPAVGS